MQRDLSQSNTTTLKVIDLARMLVISTLLALAFSLSGCASINRLTGEQQAGGGSAVYNYEKTNADGSKVAVTITSGRDVGMADISVDQNGALTAHSEALNSSVLSSKALDAANAALKIVAPH